MNHYIIQELADKLTKVIINIERSGKISKTGIEQLKKINKTLSSSEKDVSGFVLQDVIHQAQTRDIYLTEKQGNEILDMMEHKMDAAIGMNWDVIDTLTDQYLKDEQEES